MPAKRLSAHQLEVPDWGICFELEKEIPEDISFVGDAVKHYSDSVYFIILRRCSVQLRKSADLEPAKNSSIMQMDRL